MVHAGTVTGLICSRTTSGVNPGMTVAARRTLVTGVTSIGIGAPDIRPGCSGWRGQGPASSRSVTRLAETLAISRNQWIGQRMAGPAVRCAGHSIFHERIHCYSRPRVVATTI